jgi:hypothetical protein
MISSGVTGTWYRSKLFQLDIYGIPYMKKSRNSVTFLGISWNYTSRNSAEFRRNFSQFRTEYGIDGSQKNRQNSVSTEFRGHPTDVSPKPDVSDVPSLKQCVPWMRRPLDGTSLRWLVPWTMHPMDDASLTNGPWPFPLGQTDLMLR